MHLRRIRIEEAMWMELVPFCPCNLKFACGTLNENALEDGFECCVSRKDVFGEIAFKLA